MKKKIVIGIIVLVAIAGSVFSEENKHEKMNTYLAFYWGLGMTPSVYGLPVAVSRGDDNSSKTYGLTVDYGASLEVYLSDWFSLGSGLSLHSTSIFNNDSNFLVSVTIPIMGHINVPSLQWLYAGAGLAINIPLWDTAAASNKDKERREMQGVFLGIPIDIGFDFMEPGEAGNRLLFRIAPEFHKRETIVPIGIIWQHKTWKLQ